MCGVQLGVAQIPQRLTSKTCQIKWINSIQNWIPEEAGVFIGREFQDKVLQKFVSKIIKCG